MDRYLSAGFSPINRYSPLNLPTILKSPLDPVLSGDLQVMSFTARADADFMKYIEDLARMACVALTFTGPIELKYKVEDGCTIVVTVKKE